MSVGVSYRDKDGNLKEFVLEEGDDTNLMLGGWKSPFTVLRSWYYDKDEEGKRVKRYEFWVKCPNFDGCKMVLNGNLFGGMSNLVNGWIKMGNYQQWGKVENSIYPTRPSDRQSKLVFDSDRTALASTFASRTQMIDHGSNRSYVFAYNDTVSNWVYAGGVEKYEDGNFSLYGYAFQYVGKYTTLKEVGDFDENGFLIGIHYEDVENERTARIMFFTDEVISNEKIKEMLVEHGIAVGNEERDIFNFDFNGKIAEVHDWEITENNTPVQNVYYVVIENRKGKVLEVKKAGFGDEVNGKIIKDDIVIFK